MKCIENRKPISKLNKNFQRPPSLIFLLNSALSNLFYYNYIKRKTIILEMICNTINNLNNNTNQVNGKLWRMTKFKRNCTLKLNTQRKGLLFSRAKNSVFSFSVRLLFNCGIILIIICYDHAYKIIKQYFFFKVKRSER